MLSQFNDSVIFSDYYLNKQISQLKRDLSSSNLKESFSTIVVQNAKNCSKVRSSRRINSFSQKSIVISNSTNEIFPYRKDSSKSSSSVGRVTTGTQKLEKLSLPIKISQKDNRNKSIKIDNKYNIIYAENKEDFEKKVLKFKKKKKNQCLFEVPRIDFKAIEKKVDLLKEKVNFIKSVSDYTFPKILVEKIRQKTKILFKKTTSVNTSTTKVRNKGNTIKKSSSLVWGNAKINLL